MISLKDTILESNKNIQINFEGGDLSSDSGLFLFSEFCHKIRLDKIINEFLHISSKSYRKYSEIDNLKQTLFQIFWSIMWMTGLTILPMSLLCLLFFQKNLWPHSQPCYAFFISMAEETLE